MVELDTVPSLQFVKNSVLGYASVLFNGVRASPDLYIPAITKQEQSSTQENYGIDRVWKIRHNVAADLSGGRIMMLKKLKFKSLIRLKKRRRRFHLMLLLAQYPVKPNAEQFHSFIITSIMVTSDIWTTTNAISKEVGLLQCSQRQTHLEKLIKSKICRNTASG